MVACVSRSRKRRGQPMRFLLYMVTLLLISCGGASLQPRERAIDCLSQKADIYPDESRTQWFRLSGVATQTDLPLVEGENGETYPCAVQSPSQALLHGYCYTPAQVKGGLVCYEDGHVECRVLKGTRVDVGTGDLFCKWTLASGQVLACNGAGSHCEEVDP